jgi:hypothetical protein
VLRAKKPRRARDLVWQQNQIGPRVPDIWYTSRSVLFRVITNSMRFDGEKQLLSLQSVVVDVGVLAVDAAESAGVAVVGAYGGLAALGSPAVGATEASALTALRAAVNGAALATYVRAAIRIPTTRHPQHTRHSPPWLLHRPRDCAELEHSRTVHRLPPPCPMHSPPP